MLVSPTKPKVLPEASTLLRSKKWEGPTIRSLTLHNRHKDGSKFHPIYSSRHPVFGLPQAGEHQAADRKEDKMQQNSRTQQQNHAEDAKSPQTLRAKGQMLRNSLQQQRLQHRSFSLALYGLVSLFPSLTPRSVNSLWMDFTLFILTFCFLCLSAPSSSGSPQDIPAMPGARSPSAKSITLGKSHPPTSFLSQTTGVIHNRKNKAAVRGDLGPGLLRSLFQWTTSGLGNSDTSHGISRSEGISCSIHIRH